MSDVNAADEEHRFRCRNFILDENVAKARVERYAAAVGVAAPTPSGDWFGAHRRYLAATVGRRKTVEPPRYLSRSDEALGDCFLPENGNRTLLGRDISLIRVVDASVVIESGLPGSNVASALARLTGNTATDVERNAIAYALREWNDGRRYVSPEWVALYAEVADIFGSSPSSDRSDWTRLLVERLGLVHFSGPSEILVFKYDVAAIPRDTSNGEPICAVPTVLDGDLSGAFCPSPGGSREGHVVDLDATTHVAACEYLHPYVRHEVSHIYRLGSLNRDAASIADARRAHFNEIRWLYNRPDFGGVTGD